MSRARAHRNPIIRARIRLDDSAQPQITFTLMRYPAVMRAPTTTLNKNSDPPGRPHSELLRKYVDDDSSLNLFVYHALVPPATPAIVPRNKRG